MRLNYAIILVSDMNRSVAFYRDVIGLPLKWQSSHWTEFETGGATVALHLSENSSNSQTGGKGSAEHAGSCRPGLSVPDLSRFHARMIEHNVVCLQEPKLIFGSLIAQYLDPDGLQISVAEEKR